MKKFYFIAAIALAALVACSKDDDNKNNGNSGNSGDSGITIKIDGSFDDWKGSGISSCDLSEVDEPEYPNLLAMKACADKKHLYLYFEVSIDEDQEWATFGIYVDSDNNPSTGGVSWLWSKEAAGFEFNIESEEGFLANNTTYAKMKDVKCYKNLGPDGVEVWGDGWLGWDDNVAEGFSEDAGIVKNGVAYFEMSIERSVINATKTGTINIGAVTFKQRTWNEGGWWDWPNGGALPQEDAVGVAELLPVKLP